jgi:acetoin utilization deacetylase AcuC-like enzyme
MGRGHPECPERLDAIEDRLLATGVGDALDRREAPQASLDDLELAHDPRHVAALDACARSSPSRSRPAAVPTLPSIPTPR